MHRQTDYSKVLEPKDMERLDLEGVNVYRIKEPEGAFLVKKFTSFETQVQVGF